MSKILVLYISGQYSGFHNRLLLTPDKHKIVYNGSFNDFGMWQARDGCTKISDVGSGNLLGMHDAVFADGTHIHLGHNTTKVYNLQTGAQFGSATWTTGLKTEYANFLGLVFVVNGTDGMSTLSSAGVKVTDTNVTGAPVANYITEYGSRIWANDTTNKRRVHRSNAVAAGAITWDTSLEFFDVDGSGDFITGLHKARNTLMAFTNKDVEIRYFTRARLGILPNCGTLSHRSIITKKGTTFWSHPDKDKGFAGIMSYTGTGADEAQIVSTPVQDVFDTMTDSQWDDIVAWEEGSSIIWYLGGDITMPYGTVNAVSLNLKNNGWSTWYLPYTIKCAGTFMNSTTLTTQSYIVDSAATTYSRTGTRDEEQAGGTYTDIESFIQSYPLSDPADPFQYNNFGKLQVMGDVFGSTTAFTKGSRDTQFFESQLEQNPNDPSIFETPIDAKGTSVEIKLALKDTAVQSIQGYSIEYEKEGEL
jgi:hypothetical protein